MNTQEARQELRKLFDAPFRFIPGGGYIFDANDQMVCDVRAWGYLQRFPNAEKLQDTLGEMIAEALTKEFKAQETWPPALS